MPQTDRIRPNTALSQARILVCDDEELVRWSLCEHLRAVGYQVVEASNGKEALELQSKEPASLVLLDVIMPQLDGLSTLRALRERGDAVPVIMLTALGKLETAIEATRLGAARYLTKPFELDEIANAVAQTLHLSRVGDHTDTAATNGYATLLGASRPMEALFRLLRKLEAVDAPTVLITGESGTGKELVARAIHGQGPRARMPFVEVDCTAIPESLIESTLFGHERGSFTDAKTQHRGLFEVASGGVVFLDEIGELPLTMQAKLLRALESRTFKRVGGTANISLDAAVLAATNRDLQDEVAAGRFREDLYYRLAVVPLTVPPLRSRGDDIRMLAEHFVRIQNQNLGRSVPGLTGEAAEGLGRYRWPGNIRELRNVIERIMIFKDNDAIEMDDLPPSIRFAQQAASDPDCPFLLPEEGLVLERVEEGLVRQALDRTRGQQTAAAALLGLSRYALRNRMKKFGML